MTHKIEAHRTHRQGTSYRNPVSENTEASVKFMQ